MAGGFVEERRRKLKLPAHWAHLRDFECKAKIAENRSESIRVQMKGKSRRQAALLY